MNKRTLKKLRKLADFSVHKPREYMAVPTQKTYEVFVGNGELQKKEKRPYLVMIAEPTRNKYQKLKKLAKKGLLK